MEVYWSVHTWSLVAGLEARLEISLGEARLLSDSVNMCFYEAVHTRRLWKRDFVNIHASLANCVWRWPMRELCSTWRRSTSYFVIIRPILYLFDINLFLIFISIYLYFGNIHLNVLDTIFQFNSYLWQLHSFFIN